MQLIKSSCKTLLLILTLIAVGQVFGQISSSAEYVMIGYENEATLNPVYRLAEKLSSGETTLQWQDDRGYLESLLSEFDIDDSSQLLVFSPTSLQHRLITKDTPRALYFSEDMYIGYVLDSEIVEITTVDDKFGMVFYIFNNKKEPETFFDRTDQVCLVCHDSQGTLGGGIPTLLALSSVFNKTGIPLKSISGAGNIVDQSDIADRWGGWYVTGQHGTQTHLGNVMLNDASELPDLDNVLMGNIDSLENMFDTGPYLRPTSDIVSLMVLEHQLTVQNQITFVQFKAPAVLERQGMAEYQDAESWAELSAPAQGILMSMLNKLVDLMLMKDAAEFQEQMSGDITFATWFQARGPADSQGRSLRELDLENGLFRYPLSYLIYTAHFDALPAYARDYVLQRLASILEGTGAQSAELAAEKRQVILEILRDTKPGFGTYLSD